jgi:hypothetical protein
MRIYTITITIFFIISCLLNWFFAVNTSYDILFHKNKSVLADTNMISTKRISRNTSMGVYYCEYDGKKFIITSTGGIIQVRDEKKEK